mmetsp:Transcript_17801/g.20044  ORF Transcript_17801/g.20044 Transcript_17801/m.20044 type:complete len:130 (-) Transcript_17801:117-506(-)|eukprot:CAMPEP_0195260852 /NCGR_PEP_ID=MMETSP0706-20130129/8800_1 /TAXON_ID=33640 /ORGANISM="Asterionellopsis glacialis, Strain CCMP134" /LENGTH=129 /DNA_ID=CAMNT_0040314609 /DNA_START=106 /DNA_END=495 /DNA_ORIENTATION=-
MMEPMPARIRTWITTTKKTQRLTREKLGRKLGTIPKEWKYPPKLADPTFTLRQYSDGNTLGLALPDPYYIKVCLTAEVIRDLQWWDKFIKLGDGRSATLITTWDDGSGAGTGGTLGLPDRTQSLDWGLV